MRKRSATYLTEAFKRLRKKGLIARQGFMCCGSCAGTSIGDDVDKMLAQGKPEPKGAVFYTAQDRSGAQRQLERLHGKMNRYVGIHHAPVGKPVMLYLTYGEIENVKGTYGLPTVEVGKMVVEVLDELGISYEWDGDPSRCIKVNVEQGWDRYMGEAA